MSENSEHTVEAIRNTRKYMLDMLLLLCAPAVMAWYYYGSHALRIICVCIITAILTDIIVSAAVKAKAHISDLSCVFTAVCIALCMPASIDWKIPCLAVIFAVTVAVIPFGGSGNLLFCPAAAGLAFVTICFPEEFFTYPAIPSSAENLALFSSEDFIEGEALSHMLSQGNSIGVNIISYIDILVGNIPGPMGASCAMAMLGGLIYLMFRRPKGAVISISYLISCAAFAAAFPRINSGRAVSAVMELCAGLVLITALVFISDETVAPKRFVSRICYGVTAGLITMLLRAYSPLEESCVFAVLLANAVSPVFDSKIPVFGLEKKHMMSKIESAKEERLRLEKEFEEIEKAKEEREKIAQINAMLEPKRSKMIKNISKSISESALMETENIPEVEEASDLTSQNADGEENASDSDDIPTLQDIGELADRYELDFLNNSESGGDSDE